MKKFTVEEIRNYLESRDSFGDALYYLSEENIEDANRLEIDDSEDEEVYPNWDEHD